MQQDETHHHNCLNKNMQDIFISYASKDFAIVSRIKHDIEKHTNYTTWMDEDKINGGAKWESEIDAALQTCRLFLVFVSKNSNDSKWVQRETIRVDQLNKPKIPILLNDELPLRLLDLQYVDFRGPYEGGFTELKQVIQKTIQEEEDDDDADVIIDATDSLLAAALRLCLKGDIQKANENLQQALVSEPDLATSPEEVWNILGQMKQSTVLSLTAAEERGDNTDTPTTRTADEVTISNNNNNTNEGNSYISWSEMLVSHLQFIETSTMSDGKGKDGRDIVVWSLRLEADQEALLDKVDYVRYKLHKSYKNYNQVVRDRASHFRIRCLAWGTFEVKIKLFFVDGSTGKATHKLTFDEAYAT